MCSAHKRMRCAPCSFRVRYTSTLPTTRPPHVSYTQKSMSNHTLLETRIPLLTLSLLLRRWRRQRSPCIGMTRSPNCSMLTRINCIFWFPASLRELWWAAVVAVILDLVELMSCRGIVSFHSRLMTRESILCLQT